MPRSRRVGVVILVVWVFVVAVSVAGMVASAQSPNGFDVWAPLVCLIALLSVLRSAAGLAALRRR